MTTVSGTAVSTTSNVDISVQPTSTLGADGSAKVPILLTPSIVDNLKSAVQTACGKQRKRTAGGAWALGLETAGAKILEGGLNAQAMEIVGAIGIFNIIGTIIKQYTESGDIPKVIEASLWGKPNPMHH